MIGEYHDGGYWTVVPVIKGDGYQSIGTINDVGYCSYYAEDYGIGQDIALVRTVNPVEVEQALDITVSESLALFGLPSVPYGRIGGE